MNKLRINYKGPSLTSLRVRNLDHAQLRGGTTVNKDFLEYDYQCLPAIVLLQIFKKLSTEDLVYVTKLSAKFTNVAQTSKKLWEYVQLSGPADLAKGELDHIFSFPIGELDLTELTVMTCGVPAFVPGSTVADPNFHLSLQKLNFAYSTRLEGHIQKAILNKCRPVELILDRSIVTIPMLRTVSKNKNLKVLSMKKAKYQFGYRHSYSSEQQFQTAIASIRSLNSLEKLMLNDTIIEDERMALSLLNNCTNLRHLGISLGSLLPKVLKTMAKLEFLESLWFSQSEWRRTWTEVPTMLRLLPRVKAVYIFIDNFSPSSYENDSWQDGIFEQFLRGGLTILETELINQRIGVTTEHTEAEFKLLFHRH